MEPTKLPDFDINAAAAADTAVMEVMFNDQPTGWKVTFAGPAHPITEAIREKAAKEAIAEQARERQAQVNRRKFKATVETPEERRVDGVKTLVARIISWTPVKMGGELIEFSPDVATKLLLDHRYGWLLEQFIDFLSEDNSFTKSSATN